MRVCVPLTARVTCFFEMFNNISITFCLKMTRLNIFLVAKDHRQQRDIPSSKMLHRNFLSNDVDDICDR